MTQAGRAPHQAAGSISGEAAHPLLRGQQCRHRQLPVVLLAAREQAAGLPATAAPQVASSAGRPRHSRHLLMSSRGSCLALPCQGPAAHAVRGFHLRALHSTASADGMHGAPESERGSANHDTSGACTVPSLIHSALTQCLLELTTEARKALFFTTSIGRLSSALAADFCGALPGRSSEQTTCTDRQPPTEGLVTCIRNNCM